MDRERLNPDLVHLSPDWVDEPIYFITICAKERHCDQLCRKEIFQSIKVYHGNRRWHCHVALLMPDHAHFLLSFDDMAAYPRIIGDWKRWTALRSKVLWQENFFEHRLRKEESFTAKADYILRNPVRAGLVKEWPYLWMPS